MMQPFLRRLERRNQVENRFALLAGHHTAVGEAAPIEVPLDPELDRMRVAATPQEIGVERMGVAIVGHGAPRCYESLGDGLAPEDATRAFLQPPTDEPVSATRIEVEQQDELGNEVLGVCCNHGRIRHGQIALRGKVPSVNVCRAFAAALAMRRLWRGSVRASVAGALDRSPACATMR